MYSIGGIAGAAGGSMALALGMTPSMHLTLAGISGCALVWLLRASIIPTVKHTQAGVDMPSAGSTSSYPSSSKRTSNRSLALWSLGIVALIALIAEGAMYDWLTVYMREVLAASHVLTSAVYAVFTTGMAIGRFSGDAIRLRIGNDRLLCISGVFAGMSVMAGLLLPYPKAALLSFSIAGLGFANIMPLLTLSAARIEGIHAAEGIARIAGMAYVGLLIGPVLIGAVAQVSSLPIALSLVALCAVLVGGIGPGILRKRCF
jgi:fucose permease